MIKEFVEGSGDIHSLCAKLVFHEELKDVDIKDIKNVRPDLRTLETFSTRLSEKLSTRKLGRDTPTLRPSTSAINERKSTSTQV